MIRYTPFVDRSRPEEARYFQLMALGFHEDEPVTIRRTPTVERVPDLIGARRFGLMATAALEDEEDSERDLAA